MTTAKATFTVNAGTTVYLSVSFRDQHGNLAVPSSVEYRVDCPNTGQAVRAVTSVTPAATVEIALSATDNTLLNAGHDTEFRTVTVRGGYGADDAVVTDFTYQIRKTRFS
ncbi:MAG: hypothetical protein U1E83_01165 [Methylotetracoccus sp.]